MGCIPSIPLTKKRWMTKKSNFKDRYHLGKQLGRGNSSIVLEGRQYFTGQFYAIKVFKKNEMKPADRNDLQKEIQVLRVINHTHIIQFYGDFQDKDCFYLVLELMQGGNLLDRIIQRQSYTEVDARNTCKQIVEAIEYCHSKKIVHRDLKPDNALLLNDKNHSQVKLGDFGFAVIMIKDEEYLMTACGTPHFVAPEIIKAEPYGKVYIYVYHDEKKNSLGLEIFYFLKTIGWTNTFLTGYCFFFQLPTKPNGTFSNPRLCSRHVEFGCICIFTFTWCLSL